MVDKEHVNASDRTDVDLPSTSQACRQELEEFQRTENIPQMKLMQLPKIVRYNATSQSVEITQPHHVEKNRPVMNDNENTWNQPQHVEINPIEKLKCMKHQQMENCQQPLIVRKKPANQQFKQSSSPVDMTVNSNKFDLCALTTERNFRKQQMIRILEELAEYRSSHRQFEENYMKFKKSVCLTTFVFGAVVVAILFFL